MADNVAITPGSGATVATDEIGGFHYQRVKLAQGADGSATDVSSAAPLQVSLANHAANATAVKVDGSAVTQPVSGTVTETNSAAIAASLSVVDDWDESDRAKVNPIVGQAGVAGGAGAVGVTTQRVTLASDDPAVASLSVLDDWDETDRAKVNPIVGQAGVAAGAGAVGLTTQRATLASDDPAVTALQIIDDWDETDRAKVNVIAGQAGISAGAGAVAANTPRVTHASDDPAVTALQLIDDPVFTDDAAFTPAISKVMMAGFEYDDTTPDSVDEGDAGAARMSANRNVYMQIRDAAGNERGVNVDASNRLNVTGPVTNAGTFAVQENGAALTSLQLIDDAIFAEDAAHTTGDKGIPALTVRANTAASLSGADNDYQPIISNTRGAAWVAIEDGAGGQITSFGGGTQYTEDAAAAADPVGTMQIMRRKDTLSATEVSADGDNIATNATSRGEQYVHIDPRAGTIAKAEDVANADADVGVPAMFVRKATPANLSGTDGDYEFLQGNAGALWVSPLGFPVTVSTDVTRPADTTAYAANDALSDSTSAPTSGGFTFTSAARKSGGSGIITDAIFTTSADAATTLQAELWIFDTSVTNINDNSAFAVSDTEIKTCVAKIPFTMEDAGNNGFAHVQNLSIGFTCVGSANLRFLYRVKNAYTPANAEVITARLKIIQLD